MVGIYEYTTDSGLRGVTGTGRLHGGGGTRRTESPLALRRMRAALCPTEKPLLSACCDAAALPCLAPLPPANKRASVRRRC